MKRKKERSTQIQHSSQIGEIWYRLRKNKAAMVGLGIIIVIILVAIFADVIADYDLAIDTNPEDRLQGPSAEHWFGTDANGRDLLARIVHGSRYSLLFGFGCTFFAMVGGTILGAAAAFYGGKVDETITFIIDAIMCIPGMLMSLSLVAALGTGLVNLMLALTITGIPGFARLVRSIILGVTGQEYIKAAKAIGVSNIRTIFVHVLPNSVALIVVNAAMSIAGYILSASGLSYLGMGIQPPAPEWGAMLNDALQYVRTDPHIVIFPGLAILLTSISFNLLGDGLSEALDPKMKD